MSWGTFYRGSVKDVVGPVEVNLGHRTPEALLFRFTNAYSVFDWGKMPDAIDNKGQALALIAADLFERVESPATWQEFSKSLEAHALRKGMTVLAQGTAFNELGESLKQNGMRTHYLGMVSEQECEQAEKSGKIEITPARESTPGTRSLAVEKVSVVKPVATSVLGRTLMDYSPTRAASFPRLVPLEVVFRFGCTEGSSVLSRIQSDPNYYSGLIFPKTLAQPAPGVRWDFPLLELFTKLETTDRPVTLAEATAISGITAEQLERILIETIWLAGYLKHYFGRAGIELVDGKFEWAIDAEGTPFWVDSVGPDEVRLLKEGVHLSKEILRIHYRKTRWYEGIERAKQQAAAQGTQDWKRLVLDHPTPLPAPFKELASQMYQALANELTGRKCFESAWSLTEVCRKIQEAS